MTSPQQTQAVLDRIVRKNLLLMELLCINSDPHTRTRTDTDRAHAIIDEIFPRPDPLAEALNSGDGSYRP